MSEGRFRPVCTCGYRGELYHDKAWATLELNQHLMERHGAISGTTDIDNPKPDAALDELFAKMVAVYADEYLEHIDPGARADELMDNPGTVYRAVADVEGGIRRLDWAVGKIQDELAMMKLNPRKE